MQLDMPPKRPGLTSFARETAQMLAEKVREAEEFLRVTRPYLDELRRITGSYQPSQEPGIRINPKAPAIDTIVASLDQVGTPQSKEAIVQKMVELGVNANVHDAPQQIRKSIDYHLLTKEEKRGKWKHVRSHPAKLKMFGELIGKAEWKEGAFPGEKK